MAKENNHGANLGFESELWRAADALRCKLPKLISGELRVPDTERIAGRLL